MLVFHVHLQLPKYMEDLLSSMAELNTLKLMFSSPGASNWNSSSVSRICISCYINSIFFIQLCSCIALGIGPGASLR